MYEESYDLTRRSGDKNDPNNGFDPTLLVMLKVFTIDEASVKRLKTEKKALEPSIDLGTLGLLHEVIRCRQNDYIKSIAEDVKALQDDKIQGRHRMAIKVRLGEKEILALSSDFVNQKRQIISTVLCPSIDAKPTSISASPTTKRRRKE